MPIARSNSRGVSVALLLLTTAVPALAQGTAPPPGPPAPPPQSLPSGADPATAEITVVGTRIKGLDLSGAVQAFQIDRAAIIDSGATSLIDVLQQLPITKGGTGSFSTATGGPLSSDTPVGGAGVSLRGLGTSATLTLINGRRASVSAFAKGQESFIDVNSLPLAAVERVEILPNGASALYGADAVAGVINYVLRKDYKGLEISGSYGDSTAGSNEAKTNFNLVGGFQAGDHHFMAVVDYFKRSPFYLRDRAVSANSFRPSQQGFYPSFNDLFLQNLDQTEEPQDGGCPAANFGTGNLGEFCSVNTNAFVSAQDRQENIGGLFTHRWAASDRISWFNEVIFQHTNANGTGSPANFSRTPVDPENPNFPQALKDDIVADAGARRFSSFFEFPIFAYGKLLEPRAVSVRSDSFRVTSGLEFKLGGDWSGEAALLAAGNDRVQRGLSGLVLSKAFYDANLGNLCSDGSRVRRWDVDYARPDASFVGDTCEAAGKTTSWFNPFGGQTKQPAGLIDRLTTQAERRGKSRMYSFDANASGTLFEFRGRSVKAAFGGEYRRETLRDTPSGVAVATPDNPEPILGFSSTSAHEKRDSYAFYGELYVPLAERLDVQLAGRFDHYSGFGSAFNPKVAVRWQPVDFLTLRGNYATSFRAPSLAQSGAGVLLSSFTVDCVKTPQACDGDAGGDGEALLSEDVGNPGLGAEHSRSFGAGVLIQPMRDVEFKVDYFNIRNKDLVGIDEDDFIRRALAGAFPVVGSGLLPTGTPGLEVTDGFVTDAHFQITNLGYQKTSGIDVSYTHYLPDTRFGRFSLLADATYIIDFDRKASNTSPVEHLAGDYLYPDLLASAKLRWRMGGWRASFGGNYISSYKDDPTPRVLAAVGLPAGAKVKVKSYTTFDANLSYELATKTTVQLNVRNLFDKTPPRVLGSSANVDLYNHDLIGRFITVRLTQAF